MESGKKEAPLATLSTVAPSLESSPIKREEIVLTEPFEKPEVTFITNSLSSTSSSSESDSEEDEVKPKIPDGGWGWIVVFSSLLVSMIADGVSLSFGLLFPEFLIEFKASSSDTSWIGSLFLAVPLISGPIMSALVDKYGCRIMTCVGGSVAALGFIMSCRADSISIMYLTFGILAGLGLGLCYVTAVVSIAFWFDKKRTLAVGISASGTGVGTFIFSPLTNLLIFEFGWRGTTLILGGLFLNMCVCGALMRDPDWITEQNKVNSKLSKSSKSSKTSLISLSSTNFLNNLDIDELKDVLKSGKNVEYLLQGLETSIESNNVDKSVLKNNHNSVLNLPTYIRQNEKVPIEVLEQLSSNKKLYNVILENFPSLLLTRSTSDKGLNKLAEDASLIERVPITMCMTLKKEEKTAKKLDSVKNGKDVEAQEPLLIEKSSKKFGGLSKVPTVPKLKAQLNQAQRQNYFKNLKLHRQSLIHRGAIFNNHKYRFKASSCPNIYRVSTLTLKKSDDEKWYDELLDLVKGICDFSLFLELHFFLLSLSTITLFVWFIVPYFYLVEHMTKHGYTNEDASLTISNIGITNTIGMIALGWAGDQPWMNITKTYAICLVLTGVSCAGLMFFTHNFIVLEMCAALFGVFVASTYSFTPGIIVELVPLDRFTTAYGLQLLCMGIGLLVGPPYAGHLYDVTNSWEQAFYQSSIWIIISGLMVALIPYTKNRKILGKGPVEKVIEDSKDVIWITILLIGIFLILLVPLMYFTIVTII
ncbi:monocarboxylate transporter 12-like [Diorhabda sublineata]|uniref:monocarboxylate transporter 12-like n=1 Tax=Diorhabda sublineata TaxID=1163346 RepID=UPI0024E150D9|nr:monocarboxylate transporter 12-like [Diorhabda sublineata]XP_056642872.1 monocarboxylate transporter 12-like [Diorhabda sublineata]XP_056647400.1 monocarboxylate transporter 12-like [Diorhabda sublineata]